MKATTRIIAVWGSRGAGSTTFNVQLARSIFAEYGSRIICVFPDISTPVLPVLFPNTKSSELPSMGAALSGTEITQTSILRSLITTEKTKDIGFMGFRDSENRYSFPAWSDSKAEAFYDAASSVADVVIVDCGSDLTYNLAAAAINKANFVCQLCTPDLKSVSFFASQLPLYPNIQHFPILNVTESDFVLPIEEAAFHFGCDKNILPYVREIKQKMMTGDSLDRISNKEYNHILKKIMFMTMGG